MGKNKNRNRALQRKRRQQRAAAEAEAEEARLRARAGLLARDVNKDEQDTKKKKQKKDKDKDKDKDKQHNVQVEQLEDVIDVAAPTALTDMFAEVYRRFMLRADGERDPDDVGRVDADAAAAAAAEKEQKREDDDDDKPKKLSNRQKKKLMRLSVAELKQLVDRPDVVEIHDPNSPNPQLLVHLKAYRNTVEVPRHWLMKRKYLQGKRGMLKPPFELPQYIVDTGIMDVRSAQTAADDGKSMKQRARERMRPKMGKLDIDYEVLHAAFFKYQTKGKMSEHGDLYFQGKEFTLQTGDKKPGVLSERLRDALGMKSPLAPPPWLRAMQRYGPPPSYPRLKVPGVNTPIPPGARYGFHSGEWGKPPVDALGRPLYGDVFGTALDEDESSTVSGNDGTAIDIDALWGEPGPEEEEESDSDDSSSDESSSDDEDDEDGDSTAGTAPGIGLAAGVGAGSVPAAGIATPAVLQLRKEGTGTETPAQPKQLYTVLEERKAGVGQGELFGSAHTYRLPPGASAASSAASSSATEALPVLGESSADEAARKRKRQAALGGHIGSEQVEVSLNPEELGDLDAETLQRKYQQQVDASRASQRAERAEAREVFEEESESRRKRQRTAKKKKD